MYWRDFIFLDVKQRVGEATATCKCWGLKKCLCVHVWKLPQNPLVWGNVPIAYCLWLSKEFVGILECQMPRWGCPWTDSPVGAAVQACWGKGRLCLPHGPWHSSQPGCPSSVPLLFGPGLASAELGASSISWEVVFGLGMIHPVKTSLGEGCVTASLRSH